MWRLAAQLLFYDKLKLAAATAGVAVSVLLVLTQIGLYYGFLSTSTMLFDHSSADFWVTRAHTREFDDSFPLDDRFFYRVAEIPGVERAERLVFSFAELRLKSGGRQAVEVVGLERSSELIHPWNLVDGTADLGTDPAAAVVDRTELPKLELDGIGDRAEVEGESVRIVGLTQGIRTFTTAPLLFTTLRRSQRYLRWNARMLTFVMVKAAPGVSLAELKQRLAIPGVSAYGVHDIVDEAQAYWAELTGVGVSLFSMAILAVVVGFIVVGQVLYNGTSQHIREYATLKAMGARGSAVLSLVFAQATLTALVGLALGGALSFAARSALAAADLLIVLSPGLFAVTTVLTLAMCWLAAGIPAVKLLRLEPTLVLKG